ncbi:MAG: squalene/phytoene synthase family protein [FCB group bacterium]|nr:squalene/phytoene synthase family protein [FCB group bacterium]
MISDKAKFIDFTQQPDFKQILTNPILDIAARFWENERYEAFKICYRSMRIIDDLIDNSKMDGKGISDDEKKHLTDFIKEWLQNLINKKPYDSYQAKLLTTMEKFKIPLWPWEKLGKAMIYDLNHQGFKTFAVFLRYAEGAAVAPASIFMHLCGVSKNKDDFSPPPFDIRQAARPLALFSYLVHIIRDFQKDQQNNLNYFADNILERYNISLQMLKDISHHGEITSNFRHLIKRYYEYAFYYNQKARQKINDLLIYLEPPYQLSLEMIYNLYLQIFEKIDISKGTFTTAELNPSPEEVHNRIFSTINSFSALE